MSEVLCNVRDVAIAYRGREVLHGVSFCVHNGDVIALIGANGAGKTTLLKAMIGLLPVTNGSVELYCHTTELAYLSQLNAAEHDFPATVYEVVHSGRQRKGQLFCRKADHNIVNQTLEMLGINDIKDNAISRLSGGQLQRVRLARALCARPKLLVLDEPTDGLDVDSAAQLYALLREWNRDMGVSICIATHDHGGMAGLANRVLEMKCGCCYEHS